jgi:hypothetical protein
VSRADILADAHRIGRECCDFWTAYIDQPDVSPDPRDWSLSPLDIETACIELGVDLDDATVIAALEDGFDEMRVELLDEEVTS